MIVYTVLFVIDPSRALRFLVRKPHRLRETMGSGNENGSRLQELRKAQKRGLRHSLRTDTTSRITALSFNN